MRKRVAPASFALVAIAACSSSSPQQQQTTAAPPTIQQPATSPARPRIVALGDSITAGLGLPPDEAYPALLQQKVDAQGLKYDVINAGVSGDTSAGGLS